MDPWNSIMYQSTIGSTLTRASAVLLIKQAWKLKDCNLPLIFVAVTIKRDKLSTSIILFWGGQCFLKDRWRLFWIWRENWVLGLLRANPIFLRHFLSFAVHLPKSLFLFALWLLVWLTLHLPPELRGGRCRMNTTNSPGRSSCIADTSFRIDLASQIRCWRRPCFWTWGPRTAEGLRTRKISYFK